MEYQKIQRTVYELIYEARKPQPDDPFRNRTFVLLYIALISLVGLLEGRVSTYITVPAALLIFCFVDYRINRPQLKISFAKYLLQRMPPVIISLLLLYGIFFALRKLFLP